NLFKLQSGLYRFNSTLDDIVSGYFINYDSREGYRPLYGEAKGGMREEVEGVRDVDSVKVHMLETFLATAARKDIFIVLTVSPSLYMNTNEVRLIPLIEKLASRYNALVMSFADDKT